MAFKDLTNYFAPALQLPYGGKTYEVQPPTKDTGLKLAAINAAGVATYAAVLEACPTCGRSGSPAIPDETLTLIESIKDVDLGRLSLGEDVYAEMISDEVPGPHLDQMALYAMYFWVMGEATADAIFEAQTGGGVSGEAVLGSSTPKPGPRTVSGNQTQPPVSTRPTGESRKN